MRELIGLLLQSGLRARYNDQSNDCGRVVEMFLEARRPVPRNEPPLFFPVVLLNQITG